MGYSRGLGELAAARCENATTPRCRCRCGGKLHGAKRVIASPKGVWALPKDDPHHPENRDEQPAQAELALDGKEVG